jgi:hypothetical protein
MIGEFDVQPGARLIISQRTTSTSSLHASVPNLKPIAAAVI